MWSATSYRAAQIGKGDALGHSCEGPSPPAQDLQPKYKERGESFPKFLWVLSGIPWRGEGALTVTSLHLMGSYHTNDRDRGRERGLDE